MDYCVAGDDGTAAIWHGQPNLDLDGDGRLDAIGLDFDGDGLHDDALADLDGDGSADHAVLDLDNDGTPESYFTDDGSGSVGGGRGPGAGNCAGSGSTGWRTRRSVGRLRRPRTCR